MDWKRAAIDLLEQVLEDLGEAEIESDSDGVVTIWFAGRQHHITLVEWGHTPSSHADRTTVWVLRRASAETRSKLRRSNENFVDLRGSVRLRLPGLAVDRADLRPPEMPSRSEIRNAFADRASRVARVLFGSLDDRSWSVQELAEEAEVSLALTSYAVRALEERELVRAERVGREKRVRLRNARALVSQWTAEYNWRRNAGVTFHAPVGDPSRFIRRLPRMLDGATWALTLQAGASLVAPVAMWERVHVYIRSETVADLRRLAADAGWRPAEDGKLVLLAPHYRESVWFARREIDAVPVVSDLQLILDLWHYPVRGREQAEALLQRSETQA